jgi:hypothetical protein
MWRKVALASVHFGCSILSAFTIAAGSTPVRAQDQDCSKALVTNVHTFGRNYAARLAISDLVTQTNFDAAQQKGTIDLIAEGFAFDGTWESFKQARQQLRRMFASDFQIAHAQQFASYYLSKEGAEAFSQCVRDTRFLGTKIWVLDATPEYATLMVRWVPSGQSTATLTISVDGGSIISPYSDKLHGPSEISVIVKRNPSQELRANANVTGGTAAVGTVIPAFVEYEPVTTTNLKQTAKAEAKSTGSSVSQDRECLDASDGFHIVPSRTVLITTDRKDERRKGISESLNLTLDTNNPEQVCVTATTSCLAKENECWVEGYAEFYEQKIDLQNKPADIGEGAFGFLALD